MKTGTVTWRSPSNIALVKYWGKKGYQLPANPSISMTLDNCYTETSIAFTPNTGSSGSGFEFLFEGKPNQVFANKISGYIKLAMEQFPLLSTLALQISSSNSFPHSAGIASSASAFSSLALCLCDINREITQETIPDNVFLEQASSLARIGSGSACRSIYGGLTLWGKTDGIPQSADEYAISITDSVNASYKHYFDSILIVSSEEKAVKSSQGHAMMRTNPFSEARSRIAHEKILKLIDALSGDNNITVRQLVEEEAASLHAMFMTSDPSFSLIKPGTESIIQALLQFRAESGTVFFYTLDAGPNIHLLYPPESRDLMLRFIQIELVKYCEDGKWIDDRVGSGPKKLR